jgi:hypothetical protein
MKTLQAPSKKAKAAAKRRAEKKEAQNSSAPKKAPSKGNSPRLTDEDKKLLEYFRK